MLMMMGAVGAAYLLALLAVLQLSHSPARHTGAKFDNNKRRRLCPAAAGGSLPLVAEWRRPLRLRPHCCLPILQPTFAHLQLSQGLQERWLAG